MRSAVSPFAVPCCVCSRSPRASPHARVTRRPAAAPTGLHAFLLRADEPLKHDVRAHAVVRVEARARRDPLRVRARDEQAVPGAAIIWSNVDKELTSADDVGDRRHHNRRTRPERRRETTVADANLRAPAVSVDLALPWITGKPYALYAHVRAVTRSGPTPWSKPFGFNMRWPSIPRDLDSPTAGSSAGLPSRARPRYEVWLMGPEAKCSPPRRTSPTRASCYTFHRDAPQWTSDALVSRPREAHDLRRGRERPARRPPTARGARSTTTRNRRTRSAPLASLVTISDTDEQRAGRRPQPHAGVRRSAGRTAAPPTSWAARRRSSTASTSPPTATASTSSTEARSSAARPTHRASPARSRCRRTRSPSARAATKVLDFGTEGDALMLDGTKSVSTEVPDSGGAASGSGSGTPAPKIDLPDTAWPSGGYYWTVVPVHIVRKPDVPPPASGGPATVIPIEYRETELPQDACQSGRLMRFGKTSPPVVTSAKRPFVSGLSPNGRLVSANRSTPAFYGTPLVAWQPALGAQDYEVQWSRSVTPFKPVGSVKTAARRPRCCRLRPARGTTACAASTRSCRSGHRWPGRRRSASRSRSRSSKSSSAKQLGSADGRRPRLRARARRRGGRESRCRGFARATSVSTPSPT